MPVSAPAAGDLQRDPVAGGVHQGAAHGELAAARKPAVGQGAVDALDAQLEGLRAQAAHVTVHHAHAGVADLHVVGDERLREEHPGRPLQDLQQVQLVLEVSGVPCPAARVEMGHGLGAPAVGDAALDLHVEPFDVQRSQPEAAAHQGDRIDGGRCVAGGQARARRARIDANGLALDAKTPANAQLGALDADPAAHDLRELPLRLEAQNLLAEPRAQEVAGARGGDQNHRSEEHADQIFPTQAQLARKAKVALRTIHSVEKGMNCRMDTKRKILLALGQALRGQGSGVPVHAPGSESETPPPL